MLVKSRQVIKHRHWPRLVAGSVLAGVLSLTCTPICGSVLDVDSLSCCQRHGCLPAPRDSAAAMQAGCSHARAASAIGSGGTSIGYDADGCCQEGQLTYPRAQVRASGLSGSVLLVPVEFALAPANVTTQFSQRTRTTLLLRLTPNPLYMLHATFRI